MKNLGKMYLYIINRLEFASNIIFKASIKKQTDILSMYNKEKISRIERSFYQYKSQMKLTGIITRFILNFLSFFVFHLFLYPKLKLISNKNSDSELKNEDTLVIAGSEKYSNLVPNSLKSNFRKIHFYTDDNDLLLDCTSKKILDEVKMKYFMYPYFLVKVLYKLILYTNINFKFKPSVILSFSEYSFTSSIATEYSELCNIKSENAMHGEKLFNIRDSFFSFHKMYIWDLHYKTLFNKLNALVDTYVVELPEKFSILSDTNIKKDNNSEYNYTYYLGGETIKDMRHICDNLLNIINKGYKVCIRAHPIYSNIKVVKKIFKNIDIENADQVNIRDSLNNTQNIIALYSTVLFQANLDNKSIVIDDITNPTRFKKLQELDFIIFTKKYKLLSSIL